MKIQLTELALLGRYFHLQWALRLPLREKVHMDTPLTGLCESEHDPGGSYSPEHACVMPEMSLSPMLALQFLSSLKVQINLPSFKETSFASPAHSHLFI